MKVEVYTTTTRTSTKTNLKITYLKFQGRVVIFQLLDAASHTTISTGVLCLRCALFTFRVDRITTSRVQTGSLAAVNACFREGLIKTGCLHRVHTIIVLAS